MPNAILVLSAVLSAVAAVAAPQVFTAIKAMFRVGRMFQYNSLVV